MTKSSEMSDIQQIDKARARHLLDQMLCPVNLHYVYQVDALVHFDPKNAHLYALTLPGASDPSSIILYKVMKGRRSFNTLSLQLLLVSKLEDTQVEDTQVAQALICHCADKHTANRVEAQVIYHDPNVDLLALTLSLILI